jgi:hypothetical protein
MDGQFEYYNIESRSRIKNVIAQYISSILKNEELLKPEKINLMDRMKLAEEFIKKRTYNGIYTIDEDYIVEREYEPYELENDVAEYIDLKLPQHYWYKCLKSSDESHLDYPGIIRIVGVEYFYSINYEREKILLQEYQSCREKRKSNVLLTDTCEICKAPLIIRDGRYGKFLGCSNFPSCNYRNSLK